MARFKDRPKNPSLLIWSRK